MDFENLRGDCPNCKHGSAFQRSRRLRVWPTAYLYGQANAGGPPEAHVWVDLNVYRCLHCDKTTTYREQWVILPAKDDGTEPELRLIHREMVYPNPSPRELHETVPDGIRSLYGEASKCEQTGALRAAGVMYRAAVEELAKERGATGRDLYAKIEDLKTKGLDGDLVDDLHEARMLGNDSIHAGLTYSAEEVADVAGLIEEATVTLYVQPEQKRAMREARKQRRAAAKVSKTAPQPSVGGGTGDPTTIQV